MSETLPSTTFEHEGEIAHTHDEHLRGFDFSRGVKTTANLGKVAFESHLDQYIEDRDGVAVIPAAE